MFRGYGKLLYSPSWWLILKADEEICRYYRNLIHFRYRSLQLNPSRNGAHITVIAGKYEIPDNEYKHLWNKYEGEEIDFRYNPEIDTDGEYFWMEVECKRIEEIREELGFTPKIPQPWHLTVGNVI